MSHAFVTFVLVSTCWATSLTKGTVTKSDRDTLARRSRLHPFTLPPKHVVGNHLTARMPSGSPYIRNPLPLATGNEASDWRGQIVWGADWSMKTKPHLSEFGKKPFNERNLVSSVSNARIPSNFPKGNHLTIRGSQIPPVLYNGHFVAPSSYHHTGHANQFIHDTAAVQFPSLVYHSLYTFNPSSEKYSFRADNEIKQSVFADNSDNVHIDSSKSSIPSENEASVDGTSNKEDEREQSTFSASFNSDDDGDTESSMPSGSEAFADLALNNEKDYESKKNNLLEMGKNSLVPEMIVKTVVTDLAEGGKSFSSKSPGDAKNFRIVPRNESINLDTDHNMILLQVLQNQRIRGTKLQGGLLHEHSNETNGSNVFSSHGLSVLVGQKASIHNNNMNLFDKSVAAVNRIGTVDDDEASQEHHKELVENSNEQEASLDNLAIKEKNLKIKGEKTIDADQNSLPVGKAGDSEGRWAPSAKNQNKYSIPGYMNPSSSNTRPSGYFSASPQISSTYKPKHPGWAQVTPYQSIVHDPISGAYQFTYGDAYQWRHEERRADGVVFGGYGWLDEVGAHHVTRFIADARGYRVLEPGQQIDFNVLPVYPPATASNFTLSTSYPAGQNLNMGEFLTPQPLLPEPYLPNNPAGVAQAAVPGRPVLYPGQVVPGSLSNSVLYNPPAVKPSIPASAISTINDGYQIRSNYSLDKAKMPIQSQISIFGPAQGASSSSLPVIPQNILNNLYQQVTDQEAAANLPFTYRGPLVDEAPSVSNLIKEKEKGEGLDTSVVRPASSHPLPSGKHNETIKLGPNTGEVDQQAWTSSVIRIPNQSQSLDYAFLTDDDKAGDTKDWVHTDDISKYIFNLLQASTGTANTNLQFKNSLLNAKNRTELRRETLGDYLGSVKFKIPVLGSLDKLSPFRYPASKPNQLPNHSVTEYKGEMPQNKGSSFQKGEPSSTQLPMPPPPQHFFTELLKQLMTAQL